jgi:esterase/lipase superfamily enzyme
MRSILGYCLRTPLMLLLGSALSLMALPCRAQLEIPITVEGQVMDSEGRPLPGVTIAAGQHVATTDDEGRFRIDLSVPPGSLEVRAYLKSHPEIQQKERIEVSAADDPGPRRITLILSVGSESGREELERARPDTDTSYETRPETPSPQSEEYEVLAPPPPPPPAPAPPPPPAPEAGPPIPASPALTSADRAIVRVLYATDRKPSGEAATYNFYTGVRLSNENLQFGMCDVSIPILHERGQFESPSIWRFERREKRGKHIVVLSIVPTDRSSFLNDLRQELNADPDGQLLVFVHGFNVSFNEAVRRTAQVSYDLEFKGAPVLYSWPSRGEVGAYTVDEATVDGTWRHFQSFLTDLALHTGARRIFVLAHSMGSRVVARAIDGMVHSRDLATLPVFTQVVLAAPDIDTGELNQLAATLKSASGRVTVYANSHDEAIKVSSKVHGAPRAGSSGHDMFLADGIDSVDATDTDTGFLQHSYYANLTLLKDLFSLFHENAPPPRAGMKKQLHGDRVFWVLDPQ